MLFNLLKSSRFKEFNSYLFFIFLIDYLFILFLFISYNQSLLSIYKTHVYITEESVDIFSD
jgi:hypothetical protein